LGFGNLKNAGNFVKRKKTWQAMLQNSIGKNFPLKVGKIDLRHINILYIK
jgi:hypothetical protein